MTHDTSTLNREWPVFNHAAREAIAERDLEGADFFSKKVFELAPDDPRPFHQYTTFLIKTKQWDKLEHTIAEYRTHPYYGEVPRDVPRPPGAGGRGEAAASRGAQGQF